MVMQLTYGKVMQLTYGKVMLDLCQGNEIDLS